MWAFLFFGSWTLTIFLSNSHFCEKVKFRESVYCKLKREYFRRGSFALLNRITWIENWTKAVRKISPPSSRKKEIRRKLFVSIRESCEGIAANHGSVVQQQVCSWQLIVTVRGSGSIAGQCSREADQWWRGGERRNGTTWRSVPTTAAAEYQPWAGLILLDILLLLLLLVLTIVPITTLPVSRVLSESNEEFDFDIINIIL